MNVTLPYGHGELAVELPPECRVKVFTRPAFEGDGRTEGERIRSALDHPIGRDLGRVVENCLARCGEPSAVIVIGDSTRGTPNSAILSPLLERMQASGVKRQNITVLIGCGKHREPFPEEIKRLVDPSLLRGIRLASHHAGKNETVYLGTTSRGTPVRLNKVYVEADLRIVTGMIEPHQLCGYSGGAKGAFIGLADEETIACNHSLLTSPMARADILEGNPMREDMEEGFGLAMADFIVNVVLDEKDQVLRAFAGTYPEAYLAGVRFARDTSRVGFEAPCNLVLVSCGGDPKDINLYQAQKALSHVESLVAPGGIVILFARCPDGPGDDGFVRWMKEARSLRSIIERFGREGFQLGAHKAFLLARNLVKARTFLVSELDEEAAGRFFLMVSSDPDDAIKKALRLLAAERVTKPVVGVVPQGTGILPFKHGGVADAA